MIIILIRMFEILISHSWCHNLSLELMTKAKACQNAGQEGSSGVTFHALRNVEKCEGMNPHTPKWAPTLGSWSPNGLPNL
jgi:hypothetical protein